MSRFPVQVLPALSFICERCGMALLRTSMDFPPVYRHDHYRSPCVHDGKHFNFFVDEQGRLTIQEIQLTT